MRSERVNISRLSPYIPGEQPRRADIIKLNTNENPYPPTDTVMKAIAAVAPEQLRTYPNPTAETFRQVAAEMHNVQPDQIIATNGGDELLRMLITAYCEPGSSGGLGLATPSYSLYDILADIHDTVVTRIQLGNDFSIPEDHADRLNDAGCRLAMLVNPHAPSGRFQPIDQLEQIARNFNGVLLIDEAYTDFAAHDALPLVRDESIDNVILLRSFSKGYSLAGLRFGYGIGHDTIIETLDKVRDSYNTDVLSQAAAIAALQSRDEAAKTWRKVIDERARVIDGLQAMGFAVPPSSSNFLLATPPNGGRNAQEIQLSLKEKGIFVRYFDQERMRDKLRITIGTPKQNDALLNALQALLNTQVDVNAGTSAS